MNARYNADTDGFIVEFTRYETIDLSVFTGMRGNIGWLRLNGLGDLHGKLRWLLDGQPSVAICEACERAIVYAEGEWRHKEDACARCVGLDTKAWPLGQGRDQR